MRIGKNWTKEEQAEVMALCQSNRELLLRMDFDFTVERPVETMTTRDLMFVVGMQIEQMGRHIAELKEMLRLGSAVEVRTERTSRPMGNDGLGKELAEAEQQVTRASERDSDGELLRNPYKYWSG